jgi:hypothetical protein
MDAAQRYRFTATFSTPRVRAACRVAVFASALLLDEARLPNGELPNEPLPMLPEPPQADNAAIHVPITAHFAVEMRPVKTCALPRAR